MKKRNELCLTPAESLAGSPYTEKQAIELLAESFEQLPPTCPTCGEPSPDSIYCSSVCAPDCPHGNRVEDCEACFRLGDEAFDAARELDSIPDFLKR